MKKRDFAIHFGLPELKSITGQSYKNLWVLIIIIYVSLIAIGIGNSSIIYLEKKMDSPFIKFINVLVPYGKHDFKIDDFKKSEYQKQFGYGEVSFTFFDFFYLGNKNYNNSQQNSSNRTYITARVLDEKSEFAKFLRNDKNILLSPNYFANDAFGVIVTKNLLSKLGYKNEIPGYISYINTKRSDQILQLPIAAVVSQLPDYTDILVSEYFYDFRQQGNCLDQTNETHQTYLKVYIPKLIKINEHLTQLGFDAIDENLITPNGIVIRNSAVSEPDILFNKIKTLYPEAVRLYDFSSVTCETEQKRADYISFSFSQLDSINSFQNFLLNKHELRVDMNTIESKANFNFFKKLSNLLSVSLIFFSIFSIFLFTTNLITNHINQNKLSLGTLKAFGLDNQMVILIYLSISGILVIGAFVIAFLLEMLTGELFLHLVINIFKINVTDEISYLSIDFYWLFISFIIIPLVVIRNNIVLKLKNKTPGDLIYDR